MELLKADEDLKQHELTLEKNYPKEKKLTKEGKLYIENT
jgi:hypothetical protein